MSETGGLAHGPGRLGDVLAGGVPEIEEEGFARLLHGWRVVGQGDRPRDHVGRDLLFGSLGRDYRAGWYHRLRREPPDWVSAVAAGLMTCGVGLPRATLVNHLVLRALHLRQLAALAADRGGLRSQAEDDLFGELARCRPVGLLLEWAGPGARRDDLPCWRGRACPWCHCRKVVRLYGRLIAGPCDPARAGTKILAMAKVRIDDVPPEGEDAEVLTTRRIAAVLDRWRPKLRGFARGLGVIGGLHGYQVGPLRLEDGRLSFRHELSVLGEVDFDGAGGWDRGRFDRFRDRAGFTAPPGRQPILVDGAAGDGPVPVEVTAMRMADRKALRWLLAGSAAHRMWGDESQVVIDRNREARTHDGRFDVRKALGVDGALALQPTFLYTPRQFWSYVLATGGRRLYSRFGTWAATGEGRGTAGPDLGTPPGETGRSPLQLLNEARRAGAAADLRRQGEAARRVFEAVRRRDGRAPGRVKLARALDEAGIVIPRRRLVEILRLLTRA